MREEYAVYKYTCKDSGQVVYVGKTNRSLKQRVDAHKREKPFEAYDCEIEYVNLSNKVETDSVEKILINFYKPVLNEKDKIPLLTESLTIPNLVWIPYQPHKDSFMLAKQIGAQYQETLDIAFSLYPTKKMYTSPVPIQGLIPFRYETLCLFGKTCEYKDGKFIYTVDEDVLELVVNNEKEIRWEIYKDIPLFSRMSDIKTKQFQNVLKFPAMISVVEDFIFNGYQCGEYDEMYELIVKDSLPTELIELFNSCFETELTERNDYYRCEFCRGNAEMLPTFRKKVYSYAFNWLYANGYVPE